MKANRIEWIDLAKGMAIFLMVCGHTSIPASVSNWIWSFHMPLFFLVSGMLFFPERHTSFNGFVLRRCRTLLIPWVVFSLVVLCYTPVEAVYAFSHFHNLYALWFLPVLFVTELMGFFIAKIQFWGGKLIVAICLASIGYLLGEYGITFPFELEVSLYATLFYMIGYVCKDALVKVKEKWIAIVALLLTNIILSIILPRTDMAVNQCGWYGLNAGNALVGTMAFFLLAKKMEKWDAKNIVRRFLTWAGNNTIIVLGLSQVLNLIIKDYMACLPLSNAISSLLRHLLLWFVLWVLSILINRFAPELIGKKRIKQHR